MGYRISTPINVMLDESKESPLNLRLKFLTSKYLFKNFSSCDNPVLKSLHSICSNLKNLNQKCKTINMIPCLKTFIFQKNFQSLVYSSTFLPCYNYNYHAMIEAFEYIKLEPSLFIAKSDASLNDFFQEFPSENLQDYKFFTAGSKISIDTPVEAGIFSPSLRATIRHKLSPETSVFTTEAWAIRQAILLIEQFNFKKSAIISDSLSVLETLALFPFYLHN